MMRNDERKHSGGWLISALLLFLAASSYAGHDDSGGNVLDDGPPVCWNGDTTATVLYYRGGDLIWRTVTGSDTLSFSGLGNDDSGIQYKIPADPPRPGPCQFRDVDRFLAISDIHGDYDSFRSILISAGVMDGSERWTWGDGHLVIDGDVFDRGPRVTECLWLIYRLQQQAPGRVHFILGNHELMVMRGDLRYVNDKYIKGISGHTGIDYQDLFGPSMELGRWLRTLPTMIRMDRTLFVHAGVAPDSLLSLMPMEEMNTLVRDNLDISSVQLWHDSLVNAVFGSPGPFWYRGYFYGMDDGYRIISDRDLEDILDFYDVDRIVVGHTEQDSLITLYDGRVIALDVPVEELGGQQALLFQGGKFYRINPDGSRRELQ